MARDISLALRQAANAPQTGEAIVILLTITHDDLPTPIRLTDNGEDIVSNSETFLACPFTVTLPSDLEDRAPQAKISVQNVDRAIVEAIRSIDSSPTVQMDIILADTPDTIEASFPDFSLLNATFDKMVVEGSLGVETLEHEPFPAGKFTPGVAPGLF